MAAAAVADVVVAPHCSEPDSPLAARAEVALADFAPPERIRLCVVASYAAFPLGRPRASLAFRTKTRRVPPTRAATLQSVLAAHEAVDTDSLCCY